MNMVVSVVAFAVVFSFIVLVHEFGHFLAARISGVKVYEFSIGFPFSPRLVTLFHHRETAFTIRLLPLGGFVSFSKDGSEDDAELFKASRWKRAIIFSAGSLFNILFAFAIFIPAFMIGKHLDPVSALWLSTKTVWGILSATFIFIVNLFTGHGTLEGLSGPIGIAVIAGKAAGKGVLTLCSFTGVLSLSLGIMNLLPLPALDGGHLMMLFVESVRRKPLSAKTYQWATVVGLALFLMLTVAVTYRDIAKLMS